jgi:hypothetical protein
MRHALCLITAILAAMAVPAAAAETAFELGMTGGYTDNLFLDSGTIHDSYTNPYASFSLYPSSSVALAASASYTAYRQVPDLSSLLMGGSISYVMMEDNRPLSFFASGEFSTRRYGALYRDYDNIHAGASLIMRYRAASQAFLKVGGAISSNEYINAITGTNRGYGVFAGVTATVIGNNSLDLEAGYDMTRFPNLASDLFPWKMMRTVEPVAENELRTVYYSVHLSRPLASHTGIGLEYAARRFVGEKTAATYGLSLDNLSPWTSFWDGQALSADIKSFFIPNFIATSSVEYRDISFMDALESSGEETYLRSRADRRTTLSLTVARPIVIHPGTIFQPTVSAGYISNSSTDPLFDYDSFSVSVNLGLQI